MSFLTMWFHQDRDAVSFTVNGTHRLPDLSSADIYRLHRYGHGWLNGNSMWATALLHRELEIAEALWLGMPVHDAPQIVDTDAPLWQRPALIGFLPDHQR